MFEGKCSVSQNMVNLLAQSTASSLYVVVGGSRGIGLAMAEALLRRTSGSVLAASRAAPTSPELASLSAAYSGRVHAVSCDVERPESIAALASKAGSISENVDAIFNVAGILHEPATDGAATGGGTATGGAATGGMPERSLNAVDAEWMAKVYAVNAMGPVLVTRSLQPMLRKGSVIVNLSARVGSIGDNGMGGWWSYRMSKSALNMATKNMALELGRRPGALAVSLHPGTTDTGLSKPFQKNVRPGKLFTTEYTAGKLLDVATQLTEEQSGGFFAYDGKPIEW